MTRFDYQEIIKIYIYPMIASVKHSIITTKRKTHGANLILAPVMKALIEIKRWFKMDEELIIFFCQRSSYTTMLNRYLRPKQVIQ